jgi:rhamnosyltransferase
MVSTVAKPVARPKILVLLATYNGAQWLGEQVDSILAQEGVDVHIVIGDDVSKDATRSLVASRWGGDGRVVFHAWDTPSGSAGANFRRLYRLVDPAGFDFVALADQDDRWDPRKLLNATAALKRSGAAGYSCSVTSFWPDGREKLTPQDPRTRGADFLFEGAGQGCTFVMTGTFFSRVRQFCIAHSTQVEALHYHDWLVYLLGRAWELEWYFDAASNMRYRQHSGNEIGSRGGLSSITRRLELVKNGWYRKQVMAAAEIFRIANAEHGLVHRAAGLLGAPDGWLRRSKLALFCFADGRRRLSDRGVLILAALAGWL